MICSKTDNRLPSRRNKALSTTFMSATHLLDANNPCWQSLRDFNTGYKYLSPLGSFPSPHTASL